MNFPKGPYEKLGRLQRAVGCVYGGRGRSLFTRNIAVSPVTTVAKSAYYMRLWASFFVKLRGKIPGRGLWFFGLILKDMVAC